MSLGWIGPFFFNNFLLVFFFEFSNYWIFFCLIVFFSLHVVYWLKKKEKCVLHFPHASLDLWFFLPTCLLTLYFYHFPNVFNMSLYTIFLLPPLLFILYWLSPVSEFNPSRTVVAFPFWLLLKHFHLIYYPLLFLWVLFYFLIYIEMNEEYCQTSQQMNAASPWVYLLRRARIMSIKNNKKTTKKW